jgi:serine-type D-Ala-D-Ala carboxypeptidase/endopeptidase (penicillin-binding protein 4)
MVGLYHHRSQSVERIATDLHRTSDNLEAQCLFLKIGSEMKRTPEDAVRGYWESLGVNFMGLRLLDGNGLARANMIRPVDLARVNLAARRANHGERFFQSLHTAPGGTIRSKNGAMSGVRTEVGFFHHKNGSRWTFAIMANGLGPSADFHSWRAKLLAAME